MLHNLGANKMTDRWRDRIRKLLRRCKAYASYALSRDKVLRDMGWLRSFRTQIPVDADGRPLPWFTYPAISFLGPRLDASMTVFEWGCGYSTLWWANRVCSVIAYEHDQAWYQKVRSMIPQNVALHHVNLAQDNEYAHAVAAYPDKFDIVVIDGRDRANCAKYALDGLKQSGVIVFDNTDRVDYTEVCQYLSDCGLRRIDFCGRGPINSYTWCTSVFYRESNCLGI